MAKPYAIVTASAKAIGREMVIALARRGYDVVVNYRSDSSRADAEETARACEALGVCAMVAQADVANAEEVASMREACVAELGTNAAVLVCNAGIRLTGPITDQPVEEYTAVIDTDLVGAMHCAHEFGGLMKQNRAGRIILMGSTTGMFPLPDTCAYATAKAGLIGLARSLALEFAEYDVTANHIASGFVSTARTMGEGDKQLEAVLGRQKIKRLATPEDVTRTIDFIIDSPLLTGATIALNGGEYMY